MGGVRRAAAGRPTPTPGIKPATQVATARRNRASGGGLCVIARGTKEQKPPFSVFSASVPWGLFKSIWCFFCVVLGRPGSSSCGYFHAKMRGTRRTAKSDRSKPALMWRKNSKTSYIFASSSPGRPRRALAASKTHTDRRRIALRTCLFRKVRISRSFKTAPRDTNPLRVCLKIAIYGAI